MLAASALLHSGDDAAKKEHLPGIASGETIATLAFTEPNGKWDASGIEATAAKSGDGYAISGTKMFVLDGAQANLLVVAAKTDAGVSLFAVDPAGAGVTRTNLATMDQTRKQAKIDFDGAPATLIGTALLPAHRRDRPRAGPPRSFAAGTASTEVPEIT